MIYSGSSESIVFQKLVKNLNLHTDPHPTPYKVSWIKKGVKLKYNTLVQFLNKLTKATAKKDLVDWFFIWVKANSA